MTTTSSFRSTFATPASPASFSPCAPVGLTPASLVAVGATFAAPAPASRQWETLVRALASPAREARFPMGFVAYLPGLQGGVSAEHGRQRLSLRGGKAI